MQPDISPLARRLAEENNVKWQGLYGSGSEGRIVERDVLEYLARVMAGEEDLNPTAEPLPAGMEAWPEEDLAAANMTASQTAAQTATPTPQVTLTPVKSHDLLADDMLGDDMLAGDMLANELVGVSAAATEVEDALDLDLTFDDAATPAPSTSAPSMSGGQTTLQDSDSTEDVDDDMFLFDDAFDDEPTLTADAAYEDVALENVADIGVRYEGVSYEDVSYEDMPSTAAMQGGATDFDLNSDELDVTLQDAGQDTSPAATAAQDFRVDTQASEADSAFDVLADDLQALEFETTPGTPTRFDLQDGLQDVALFEESPDTDADAESDLSLFVADEAAASNVEDVEVEAARLEDIGFEDAGLEAAEAEAAEVEGVATQDTPVEDVYVEAAASEDMGLEDAFSASTDTDVNTDTVDANVNDADVTAADTDTEAAPTTDSAEEVDALAPAYGDVDGSAPLEVPYAMPQAALQYEAPRVTPSTFAAAAASPQLVSYGLLLRRRVDLTQLMEAQVSIGQELGQDGPVAPGSLLLRAAAKTLLTLPLNEHRNVGLAVFGDRGVQLAAVDDVTTRPFRDIVAAVAQSQTGSATTSGGTAAGGTAFGVVVADMSDFDIDEAVLNAGAPVLTLGRILSDTTEGSQHSTLALSGEMTVEQGTKFLAAVAELLDAPIRLVI